MISGSRAGTSNRKSDGSLVYSSPNPQLNYQNTGDDYTCKDCPDYVSISITVDIPTLIVLAGAGISFINPEAGVATALTGAVLEVCPISGHPLCVLAKFSSVGGVGTIDKYLNVYIGPQYSFGKSALSPVAFAVNPGRFITNDNHPGLIAEKQLEQNFRGFSISGGTILTEGMAYSPGADWPASGYMVLPPELGSLNFSYQWMVYDAQNGSSLWEGILYQVWRLE